MNLIYKPIYWGFRAASALWYWARRRFTLAGLITLGALLVAGMVGVDIENTVTYQSFSLLLAFLLMALAWSLFFRAKFSVERLLPRLGTAGQPLRYRVRLENHTKRKQTGLLLFENLADPRPSFHDWLAFQSAESKRIRPFRIAQRERRNPFRRTAAKEAEVPPLPAGGQCDAVLEVLPLRRGILRFNGVTLARPDPLGLFHSFSKISAPQTVLILPRRYPVPSLSLPGALRYQEGGVALAANIGRSEEFIALREYRHGDPLRNIHWRSWARVGKPVVKEFQDEFFVRHALVLDTFDDEPQSEVLETAVSVAASFACTVLTQESLLDLLFVGNQSYCFTAGRGLAHVDQMLEILASVKNCAEQPFSSLEELVLSHVSLVSGCICVLQRWDGARQSLVKKLRVLDVPLLVLVVVPPGAGKLDPGPMRTDPGHFHLLELGNIEQQLAKLT